LIRQFKRHKLILYVGTFIVLKQFINDRYIILFCLKLGFLNLVRINNKTSKRRISDCSLLEEIDQVFGGFLTRKNIGWLIYI
jgi:hypothetical protein